MIEETIIADLGRAMKDINKRFGAGTIMRLGDPDVDISISTISTGSLLLDLATGKGGYPVGRIIE